MRNKSFKILAIALLAVLCMPKAQAQLEDGAIAPDWTLTDIDGNIWHLYDILDQNKSVFIDVFAVWCGPCWAYHGTGALDDLYAAYGPEGTDELMVFQIEGDGTSTEDQLYGLGGGTVGNWVAGTTYPTILTHYGSPSYTMIQDYDIGYFPTIYRICPDRIIKEVGQIGMTALYNSLGTCTFAEYDADPAIVAYTGDAGGCADVNIRVELQNYGFDNLTACTIKVFDGATELASKAWTGNLSVFEKEEVNMGDIVLPNPDNELSFEITTPDDNAVNNVLVQDLGFADNVSNTIHITVKADDHAPQIRWEILNAETGTIMANDGPYSNAQNNTIAFDGDVYLPGTGCFAFNIYDTGGDGITGTGYYKIFNDAGTQIGYGDENIGFKRTEGLRITGLTAIENTLDGAMQLYPNPADDAALLQLTLAQNGETSIQLFDMYGRLIENIFNGDMPSGSNEVHIITRDLPSGMYCIQVRQGAVQQSMRLQVMH